MTNESPDPFRDRFCPQCGYCLRGLLSEHCPECGASVASVLADVPQIPWVHRRQIGLWRAYWKTLVRVLFAPRRFCEEMARPVSYAEAQKFRWLTVLIAYGTILAAVLVYALVDFAGFQQMVSGLSWPLFAVLLVSGLLALAAMSGVHTYFFHPRWLPVELQNRAVALSYYACAPLAFVPVFALASSGVASPYVRNDLLWAAQMTLVVLLGAPPPTLWWLRIVQFALYTLRRPWRVVAVALLTPLLALLVALIALVVPPLIFLYVYMIVRSLL